MTRALLLDIGNVLVRFDPWRAVAGLAARCGRPASDLAARLRNWDRIRDYEAGRLSTAEFFGELRLRLRLDGLPFEDFVREWGVIFDEGMAVSASTLELLRRRFRLVLVSNTNPLHFECIQRRFPTLRDLDAVLSHEVGFLKPDREIYLRALELAGCSAGEAFFVDDMEENVRAAAALGIPGVRFESESQLLSELRSRNILDAH